MYSHVTPTSSSQADNETQLNAAPSPSVIMPATLTQTISNLSENKSPTPPLSQASFDSQSQDPCDIEKEIIKDNAKNRYSLSPTSHSSSSSYTTITDTIANAPLPIAKIATRVAVKSAPRHMTGTHNITAGQALAHLENSKIQPTTSTSHTGSIALSGYHNR